ncbi:oxygenase MpaB family protein [Quadrisphaera granulorum]|uniref:oxygenase MpaB family protein n=1 Tax=Quadrisphaera granulorum TaxID=317664 RepID=UPI0011B6203F|nr:oxygenase MpaB family protein [Quadrisphaera granulorum]
MGDHDDDGLFGPGSATWELHTDPMIGPAGLRALVLQALHPLAMHVVAQHSTFKQETWQRLHRTGEYVDAITFGSTAEAHRAAARVRGIHARVRGTDPETGLEYRADDEDLLLWIHCALVDSILDVVARSRPAREALSDATADRYVAEQVISAELVGVRPEVVPASRADLAAYFEEVRPHLRVTREAREAASYVIAPPLEARTLLSTPVAPVWFGVAGTAAASLPGWARRMYAVPELPGAEASNDAAVTVGLRGLRLALVRSAGKVPGVELSEHRRRALARLAEAS